jgi:hypothetical protein
VCERILSEFQVPEAGPGESNLAIAPGVAEFQLPID